MAIDTPPTASLRQMRRKHTKDSVNYNMSHFKDHHADTMTSLKKMATVDPKLAKSQAKRVVATLGDLHKEALNSMQGLNYEGAGKAVPTPMNPQSKGYLMQDTGGSKMASSKSAPLKHTGSTDGKSNALGGGGRAQQLKNRGMSGALIGYIGRKKYGASAMAKMSAAGRARGK